MWDVKKLTDSELQELALELLDGLHADVVSKRLTEQMAEVVDELDRRGVKYYLGPLSLWRSMVKE